MTGRTTRGSRSILTVIMAFEAFGRPMRADEGKRGMVEGRTFPRCSAWVTKLTDRRETRCQVVGILRGLELNGVTGGTLSGGSSKTIVAVALSAFQSTMLAFQAKSNNIFVVPRAENRFFPDWAALAPSESASGQWRQAQFTRNIWQYENITASPSVAIVKFFSSIAFIYDNLGRYCGFFN